LLSGNVLVKLETTIFIPIAGKKGADKISIYRR